MENKQIHQSFKNTNVPIAPNSSMTETQDGGIRVWLKIEQIWEIFDNIGGNEMVVMVTGRHLFPRLEFFVSGLKSGGSYRIGVKLQRVNTYLMKHSKSKGWHTIGESAEEIPLETNEVFNEILTGGELMEHGIDFSRCKIYYVQEEKKDEKGEESSKSDFRKRKASGPEPDAKRQRTTVDFENWLQVHLRCTYIPIVTVYEIVSGGQNLMSKPIEFSFPIAKFHVVSNGKYKTDEMKNMKFELNGSPSTDTKSKVLSEKKQLPMSPDSGV